MVPLATCRKVILYKLCCWRFVWRNKPIFAL